MERRFTFLVYILGGVIGASNVSSTSLITGNDEQDLFDGELVVRVLQLMTFIQQKTASEQSNSTQETLVNTAITTTASDRTKLTPYSERLELAVLFFFEQFRRQYMGDHGRSNNVYQVLFKHLGRDTRRTYTDVRQDAVLSLGIANEDQLLSIYVKKIFTNLQYSAITDRLIRRTVACFSDLCMGYQGVRKLVKLDPIQYLISNHTQDLFPFLQSNVGISSWSRLRTQFYTVIGRMLMYEFRYDDEDDDERIDAFMMPFTNQFRKLLQIFQHFPDLTLSNAAQLAATFKFRCE